MLRISSGVFRGRWIQTPSIKTRPTQSKMRQAWFNLLRPYLPQAHVLDLFSGSGALGFEALSQGAGSVVFVDSHPLAQKVILINAHTLQVSQKVKLLRKPFPQVLSGLVQQATPFDLVFADPPYGQGWELKLLNEIPWEKILGLQGYFCLEWQDKTIDSLPERVSGLRQVREKSYAQCKLTIYGHDLEKK